MSGIVIADAGPLIALARIERLSLLQTLYGPVTVPQAVLTELRLGSERPGARLLSAAPGAGEIRTRALPPHLAPDLATLSLVLDSGEAEAILLAEALSCRFLLIDERRARVVLPDGAASRSWGWPAGCWRRSATAWCTPWRRCWRR
jgi:predicted nucleic acid-binding protein